MREPVWKLLGLFCFVVLENVCGDGMCEKCNEIDAEVAHYRRLTTGITDKQALDSLHNLIADLEMQKASLHPKPPGGAGQDV